MPPFKPKAPPQPVVYNPTNAEAPFGYDEDGRPIVASRSDQNIATDLQQKEHLRRGECPHGNDPDDCLLCGTKHASTSVDAESETVDAESTAEERRLQRLKYALDAVFEESRRIECPVQLTELEHAMRGAFEEPPEVPKEPSPEKRSIRERLKLSRMFVSDLFERVIGMEDVPTEVKTLKDKSEIEQEIAELFRRIDEVKESLATRTAAYQKRYRPDDKLDRKALERQKYHERKQLDENEKGLRELQQRLKNWGQDPRDYDVMTEIKKVPIVFGKKYAAKLIYQRIERDIAYTKDKTRDKGKITEYDTFSLTYLDEPVGRVYDIDGYRRLLQEAVQRGEQNVNFRGWEEWENKVITEAVRVRAMKVPPGASKEFGIYVPPDDPREQDHNEEAELIRKTGGAQIGGGVYARGSRNGKARGLEDFDATARIRNKEGDRGDAPAKAPDPGGDDDSWSPD